MASTSQGTYRIPYRDGTTVEVTSNHLTHDPPTRIDMKGVGGGTPYRIVAAADGVIRFIIDRFGANRPDGDPCNNNYVWIEHDNGEWTKYSHMPKRSVTGDAGLAVGDRVRAGTFLGFEDDVGCAHGEHLHFEGHKKRSDPFRTPSIYGMTVAFQSAAAWLALPVKPVPEELRTGIVVPNCRASLSTRPVDRLNWKKKCCPFTSRSNVTWLCHSWGEVADPIGHRLPECRGRNGLALQSKGCRFEAE